MSLENSCLGRSYLINSVYFLCIFLLVGCASSKKILYFQDIQGSTELKQIEYSAAKIKPDDLLSIIVSAPDKEVVSPYNFVLTDGLRGGAGSDPERAVVGYLVDDQGEINFPSLGKIKVEGMTRSELADYLTTEIGKDVKDPVVSVAFKNFKITVLGEVKNPGTYTVSSEKINMLQAIGMAGDLTIMAKRHGIILLREENGRQQHIAIDLRSKNILESPYFYLQQNDVVYIPPSPGRIAQGTTATGVWATTVSSITAIVAILVLIL